MVEVLVKNLEIHEENTEKEHFFTFSTGKVAYGIEVNYVTRTIGLQGMIKIAGLHNNVKGIIVFRDRIIPVIDVQIKFNKKGKVYNSKACILILEIKKNLIGVITDNPNEVLNMDIVINYLVMMNLIKLQY